MSEEQGNDESEGRSVYLGNAVPKILRWVYVAFGVWMVAYLAKYLVPDLLTWLKR